MNTDTAGSSAIELAGDDLFNFAIEREDVKWLMSTLQISDEVKRAGIEHELQLLKIISVGWSITYWLGHNSLKDPLAEQYWQAVFAFSQNLSQTAGLMIGQDIDFFQTVKNRLDTYIQALSQKNTATEPAAVIGPEFARLCGKGDDLYLILNSSRLFVTTIARVKNYLDALMLELTEQAATPPTQ